MCSRHLLCLCCGWIDLLHKYHNAQGIDIPMVKIRRSRDRFIFIKGILFLKRRLLNWNKSPIDILPVQLPHYAQYITTGHVKTRPDFDLSPLPRHSWSFCDNGPLARYAKLRAAHAPGMFSPPLRLTDPDMHHGSCGTHVRDAWRDC